MGKTPHEGGNRGTGDPWGPTTLPARVVSAPGASHLPMCHTPRSSGSSGVTVKGGVTLQPWLRNDDLMLLRMLRYDDNMVDDAVENCDLMMVINPFTTAELSTHPWSWL